MKIDKAINTPEGTVQFQGELTADEVNFMVDWFLNTMLAHGALPFASVMQDNAHKFVIGNTERVLS